MFNGLRNLEFEYLVVDNRSTDGGDRILRRWEAGHPNMRVWAQRCTMGRGRQIAFERSRGDHILVLDTDVVYSTELAEFIARCQARSPGLAVQALYAGIFPREVWIEAGGRRSLNTHEDLDMWVRIWRLGKMRWYPFSLGENVKEAGATAGLDFLSQRYGRGDRMRRVLRHHYDLWKTRSLSSLDLTGMYEENRVDYGLGRTFGAWFENRPTLSVPRRLALFVRELRQAWKGGPA